jgi:hypothetical protein
MTRTAISPRFAIRTLENTGGKGVEVVETPPWRNTYNVHSFTRDQRKPEKTVLRRLLKKVQLQGGKRWAE